MYPISKDNYPERIVLAYLQGERIAEVSGALYTLCGTRKERCRDVYKQVIINAQNIQHDRVLRDILLYLRIIKNQGKLQARNGYEILFNTINTEDGCSLYDVLYVLRPLQRPKRLLKLIDKTNPEPNWTTSLLAASILSLLVAVLGYWNAEYVLRVAEWLQQLTPLMMDWLRTTFSTLYNINLLGIGYNALGWTWGLCKTLLNTSISMDKMRAFLFKTMNSALVIAAYSCAYFAGGVFTGMAASLFVLGASIDVFKSLYLYNTVSHSRKQRPETAQPIRGIDSRLCWQDYEDSENQYERMRRALWVKVGMAGIITVVVGVWCFSPPNLLVTGFCTLFIPLMTITKRSLLTRINYEYDEKGQESIAFMYPVRTSLSETIPSVTPKVEDKTFQNRSHINPTRRRKLNFQDTDNTDNTESNDLGLKDLFDSRPSELSSR